MRFYIINNVKPEPEQELTKIKAAELSPEDLKEIHHNTKFSLTPGTYTIMGDLLAPYNAEPGKIKVSLATTPDIVDLVNVPLEQQA